MRPSELLVLFVYTAYVFGAAVEEYDSGACQVVWVTAQQVSAIYPVFPSLSASSSAETQSVSVSISSLTMTSLSSLAQSTSLPEALSADASPSASSDPAHRGSVPAMSISASLSTLLPTSTSTRATVNSSSRHHVSSTTRSLQPSNGRLLTTKVVQTVVPSNSDNPWSPVVAENYTTLDEARSHISVSSIAHSSTYAQAFSMMSSLVSVLPSNPTRLSTANTEAASTSGVETVILSHVSVLPRPTPESLSSWSLAHNFSSLAIGANSRLVLASSKSRSVIVSSSLVHPSAVSTMPPPKPISEKSASVSLSDRTSPAQTSSTPSTYLRPSSTLVKAASTTAAANTARASANGGKLQFVGVNESGAEFGGNTIPGTLGTDYIFPNNTAIGVMMAQGLNIFRMPFLMERLVPDGITGTIDHAYLAGMSHFVTFVTNAGGYAVLDPHNFGRYNGQILTNTAEFQIFWKNIAMLFYENERVVFDCMNEPHDESTNTITAELSQACIDGVRSAGATTQYIFVEGTGYDGAWHWISYGNGKYMNNLHDPSDRLVYEMHQYFDTDGSGTSTTCVSPTIGQQRIAAATQWLEENGKMGIVGEFAAPVNDVCEQAVEGMLDAMVLSDVWMGALWWGAGPWNEESNYGIEPDNGKAYSTYMPILTRYVQR